MSSTIYFGNSGKLVSVWPIKNDEFYALGGKRSKHNAYDSFKRMVGKDEAGNVMPVTRKVFFKKNPSMHKCDARCQTATGHDCECSCGGEFHGAAA